MSDIEKAENILRSWKTESTEYYHKCVMTGLHHRLEKVEGLASLIIWADGSGIKGIDISVWHTMTKPRSMALLINSLRDAMSRYPLNDPRLKYKNFYALPNAKGDGICIFASAEAKKAELSNEELFAEIQEMLNV